jgi:hypothetical protein
MAKNEYENAIASLLAERAEIDQTIALLRRRAGKEGAVPLPGPGDAEPGAVSVPTAGELVAHAGEFHQHSMAEAAVKLLKRAGRPVRTADLIGAMRSAGMAVAQGKNSQQILYTTLTRREKTFERAAPNTWGLAEWFPNRPERPAKAKKARRKGATGKKTAAKAGAVKTGPEPVDVARAS